MKTKAVIIFVLIIAVIGYFIFRAFRNVTPAALDPALLSGGVVPTPVDFGNDYTTNSSDFFA